MRTIFQTIMEPHFENGHNVILVQGPRKNDIYPLCDDDGDIRILPALTAFLTEARKNGYIGINYSMSRGLHTDIASFIKRDADLINDLLNKHHILNSCNNSRPEEEFIDLCRGIHNLIQDFTPLRLSDNKEYRFIFSIQFAEHPLTEVQNQTIVQKIAMELILQQANSLALRKSECILLLYEERENSLNSLLRSQMPAIRIPSADLEERRMMHEALKLKYPNHQTKLSDEEIRKLCGSMMNRSLEKVFYASNKYGKEITHQQLIEEKKLDIIRQSEGTLTPVDTSRLVNKLSGRNIDPVLSLLEKVAADMKTGKKTMRNIILAGAPSTGKTALAIFIAHHAGLQAFMVNSTRRGIVGESDRITDVMINAARSFGGIFIIDEIDSLFNFDRNSSNLDSGVNASISARFLSFFSDESLAGQCLFIGTTNRPEKLSEAMLSRFSIIPVLSPLCEDMPEIIRNVCNGLSEDCQLSESTIAKAAMQFYKSGMSVREIRETLISSQLLLNKSLNDDVLIHAAASCISNFTRESYIHADMVAIKGTRSAALLPFWDHKENCPSNSYPYPQYICEILNEDNRVDSIKLNKRIKDLEPYANV